LTSSPTAETHVRPAWADAELAPVRKTRANTTKNFLMTHPRAQATTARILRSGPRELAQSRANGSYVPNDHTLPSESLAVNSREP
jgi:hypothetical protein